MAEQQVVCEGDDLFDFGFEAPQTVNLNSSEC